MTNTPSPLLRGRWLSPAIVTLACAAAGAAAPTKSPVPASPPPFEETTQVVSVEVPVNVVGRDGQAVRGLQASDFEVFDEGTSQPITSFEVLDLAVSAPAPTATPADEYLQATARRRFLLLFDLSFSTPTSVLKARLAARDFVLHALHPGDLAAVGTVSLEQGFRSVVTFTPDRAQIARGIDTLGYHQGDNFNRVDPLRFMIAAPADVEADVASGDTDRLGDLRGDSQGALRDYLQALSVMAERDQRSFDRSRVNGMLRVLGGLAHSLNSVRGRKQVVLFSEGFESQLLLGRDSSQTQEQQDEALSVARGDIWRVDTDQRFGNTELQTTAGKVLEEFRRADSVIQAVDIGGLRADTDPQKRSSSGGQDALFFMANETGGELFKNANNLRTELDRVLDRSSVTYVLTFERADVKTDGAYHRLRVRAKLPPGARLSHRAGYYAPRPFKELSPLERNLLASDSIASALPRRDVDVKTLVAPFRSGPGHAYVPVIVEIGGESLLEGQRGDRLNVEIYAYVSDHEGEMRDFFTQMVGFELAKSRPLLERTGIKYYGHLDLGPGQYLVRVLVRNAETGRGGVETLRLTVPDYTAPVLLPPFFFEPGGRWVMVRETDGKPAQKTVIYPFTVNGEPYVPAAEPELQPSAPARLCLVAYNLGSGAPSIETQVLDGTGRIVAGGALSEVERTVTGIPGYDQLLASFDAKGLAPGTYTLRVGLVDGSSGAKQVNSIPFAVRN